MPTSVSNQLGTGLPTSTAQTARTITSGRETWSEDNWSEEQSRREIRQPLRQRQLEPEYEDEDDNWNEQREERRQVAYIDEDTYNGPASTPYVTSDSDEDVTKDVWADDENPQPYRAPQVNLPERKKVVEYEEETDY